MEKWYNNGFSEVKSKWIVVVEYNAIDVAVIIKNNSA
jgi:hypothetical protein